MPSLVTWDGAPVLSGRIVLPRRGAWFADLVVDSQTVSTARAMLSANDGAWTLSGTPQRGAVFLDALQVRIVGGAGGMATDGTPRYYRNAPARFALDDLLADAGETLAADSDGAVTGAILGAWPTLAAPVGPQVARIVDAAVSGAVWRYDATGAIWCGVGAWPDADEPGDLLETDEIAACALYAVDYPALLPGVAIGGRHVSRVEHEIASGAIRTRVYFEASDAADRGAGTLSRIVRAVVGQSAAGAVDYLAGYEGVVTAQSADGSTVDVNLDDPRFDSPAAVAIVGGIPGATFKVVAGCRVLVKWVGGDPQKPYVSEWRAGASVTHATITGSTSITLDGTALVDINGNSVTVGPNPILAALPFGSTDSMGVPITINPASLQTLKIS